MRRARRSAAGVGMVEFAIALPFLLLIIFGMIDFGRAIQANTTVAEAARQGARQAVANAPTGDTPFGSYSNQSCSGMVFSNSVASNTGCLSDAAVLATVTAALRDLTRTVNHYYGANAASCPAPSLGQANVCITPADTGSAGSPASCSAAGGNPAPGTLGARQPEWQSPKYKGCFLVEVTVRYAFQPMTPIISNIIGSSIQIVSSTSTIAEY